MSGMEGRKKMFDAAKGSAQWSQEVGWGHISDITPLHLNLSWSSWVYCGVCVVVSRWCPCGCSCHGGDSMPPHPWKAFNHSVSFVFDKVFKWLCLLCKIICTFHTMLHQSLRQSAWCLYGGQMCQIKLYVWLFCLGINFNLVIVVKKKRCTSLAGLKGKKNE